MRIHHLVVGTRAMADDWAREHLLDRREVGATTEGDWQLRGLGYVPQLIWPRPDYYIDLRSRRTLDAYYLLEEIYGPREVTHE